MEPLDDNEELPDEEAHAQEIADMPQVDSMAQWQRWKQSPSPQRMADVLHTVDPVINKSVSRFPRYSPAILGGEAKRLAIAAVKSYDPAQGTALSSHIHNHLKSLGRFTSNLGSGINKSRLETQRAASFLAGQNDLREIHGREPTDAELQDHLRVNSDNLTKMRMAARGEVAESEADHLGDSEDGSSDRSRLHLWTDYTYHDATPLEKQILDLSMGRNGNKLHDGQEIAAKLNMSPQYVNRKRDELAHRIIEGIHSMNNEDGD